MIPELDDDREELVGKRVVRSDAVDEPAAEPAAADEPAVRGCCGSVRYAVQGDRALWLLFADYALSSWSDRMWAFAVPLLFVSLLQQRAVVSSLAASGAAPSASAPSPAAEASLLLLPASLYALLSQVACVACGSAVGAWIDRAGRRRVVVTLLSVQNASVALGAVFFLLMSAHGVDDWQRSPIFWLLFVLLTLCGAVGALASLGSSVAIKKDWIVVLTHNDGVRLATVNSIMRGIDLTCEIGAPMAFGIVLASLDVTRSLIFVAAWNALSFIPEVSLLLAVYRQAEALLSQPSSSSSSPPTTAAATEPASDDKEALLAAADVDDDEDDAAATARRASLDSELKYIPSFAERWRIYGRQEVFFSSIAYCLLYLTVLQPSYLLTAYLKSVGVDDVPLAGFRGVSAVVGLIATISVPVILSRGVRVESLGVSMITMQVLCLLPCVVAVFVPDAPPIVFMASVAASRFALYGFDLCAVQIMQRGVPEGVRGTVNAAESSLTNMASLLSYGMGIVVPDPAHFGYLVLLSYAAVVCALGFSAAYWRRNGGRSQHVWFPLMKRV